MQPPEGENIELAAPSKKIDVGVRKIERREWWLWVAAIFVTLLLTGAIVTYAFPVLTSESKQFDDLQLKHAVHGLIALVVLFDIYVINQQLQIFRIQHRLRESEELFRLITENAADMIAVVDAEGNRVYNSPTYEKVLGYSQEELRNTSAFEQIHPDDQTVVKGAAAEALEKGTGRRIEYRMRHKDGTWRFLESTASAVRGRGGKVERLVIVNRDITGRRSLEEQFHQAQKMEAVGRLSGGIAHDFNNLLGVIIGYSEVLQEELDEEDPMRTSADEILKAARRAATLTRQLLAFSRQQVLEAQVLDLNTVVLEMEKMLRRLIPEDIELKTVLEADLGRVKADLGQLEQVIMNLAVNARDAMPHGGKLTVFTANMYFDQPYLSSRSFPMEKGPYVCLTVTDTGVGMDLATQGRIFEPFFTTKEKGRGTGLGLATVYGVIKQSGGYIDVHSEPGVGTTFKIYLPKVQEEPVLARADEKTVKRASVAFSGNETILLVEDETALRTLARNLLLVLGYTVLEAKDGDEAVLVSEGFREHIDLLLTDMIMPGMRGDTLAGRLAPSRPDMRVLYMSGYTGQNFAGEGALGPGAHFVQKPFTREALGQKVREVLNEGAQPKNNNAAAAAAAAKGR